VRKCCFGLANRRLQPLGHLSVALRDGRAAFSHKEFVNHLHFLRPICRGFIAETRAFIAELCSCSGTKGAHFSGMKLKEKDEFKSGDVVRLISGGPDMTVVEYVLALGEKEFLSNTSNWVDCVWFDGKKRQTGRFPPESLERVKQEKQEKQKSSNGR